MSFQRELRNGDSIDLRQGVKLSLMPGGRNRAPSDSLIPYD